MAERDAPISLFGLACSRQDRQEALRIIRDVLSDEDPIEWALEPAFEWGDPEVVWALMQRSLDSEQFIHIIGERGHVHLLPTIYWDLDVGSQSQVLWAACEAGKRNMVGRIMEDYLKTPVNSSYTLKFVARSGDLDLLKYLEETIGPAYIQPYVWMAVCTAAAQYGWVSMFNYVWPKIGNHRKLMNWQELVTMAFFSGDSEMVETVLNHVKVYEEAAANLDWQKIFDKGCANATPHIVDKIAAHAGCKLYADEALQAACQGKAPAETVQHLISSYKFRDPLAAFPSAMQWLVSRPNGFGGKTLRYDPPADRAAKMAIFDTMGVQPNRDCLIRYAITGSNEIFTHYGNVTMIPHTWVLDAAVEAARWGRPYIFSRLLNLVPHWGVTQDCLIRMLDHVAQGGAWSYSKQILEQILQRLEPDVRRSAVIRRLLAQSVTFPRARKVLERY